MNKVERVSRSIGFLSALQVSPGRLGQRFDLLEGLLLLIIVSMLAACAPSSDEDWMDVPAGITSVEDPIVTAPASITVAATNASGTAATDPAISAFLNGASASDAQDGPIATINNDAPGVFPLGVTTVTFDASDSDGNSDSAQATVTVTLFVSVDMVAFSRDVGGGELDLFAIAEDGSGALVTLANDTGNEVFAGSTSDNRVVYVRDMGAGMNDIFSISDDGSGSATTLTTDARDELPVAVTASNRVIFMRTTVAPADIDLFSINADGSGGIVTLAATADTELFGGMTSDGRLVYDRLTGGTQGDVFSILADGSGGTVTLADTGVNEAGGAIAAGTLVVFARTVGGLQNDIYTIEADGLSAESLLVVDAGDELPVGVTAGNLVIFLRIAGTATNLLSIGASGTPAEVQLASADLSAFELLSYGDSTGGRVIYNICGLFSGNCDVFSRNANGSGLEADLAVDPGLNEVFAGISSDGRVIIVRVNGATTDLLSINADGSGGLLVLASAPTPVAPDEVFKGVTSNGRVIFERVVGGFSNLYSIKADGSEAEIPLATTAADETFGGTF